MHYDPFLETVVNKMNQELDLHAILLLIFPPPSRIVSGKDDGR